MHDLKRERWLFGKVFDQFGIYESKAAKGVLVLDVGIVFFVVSSFLPPLKYTKSGLSSHYGAQWKKNHFWFMMYITIHMC